MIRFGPALPMNILSRRGCACAGQSRAEPRAERSMDCMKILVLNDLNRDDPCFWIRIGFFLQRLQQEGVVEKYYLNDSEQYESVDLVIVQRHVDLSASLIAKLMAAPKPVLYETDDSLLQLPEQHPAYAHYSVHAFLSWNFFRHLACAVSVSTDPLRQYFARHNRNTWVVKNTLPYDFTREAFSGNRNSGPLKVGYVGSATHEQDYEFVVDTLASIQRSWADRAEFHFFGWVPSRLRQPGSGVHFYPFQTNYLKHLETVRSMQLDVCLAPLLDSEFNRAKSAMKYVEYTHFGAVGIYSDVEPYRNIRGGIVLRNEAARWREALTGLLENSSRRAELFDRAVSQVKADFCFETELSRWAGLLELAAKKARPVNPRRIVSALQKDILCNETHQAARYGEFRSLFASWIHEPKTTNKAIPGPARRASAAGAAPGQTAIIHELRARAAAVVAKCRADKARSLAVYGAGSHTEALIPVLRDLGAPPVTQILVSSRPSAGVFCGIPVVCIDDFDPSAADAVLLSSQRYETEMFYALKYRHFDTRVYPLWNSEEDFELFHSLKRLLRCVVENCRVNGIRRIAVFGAGSHTRLVLPIWRSYGGPEIECILVSESPANPVFMGLPVLEAARFDAEGIDAILLSSRSYEREMYRACIKHWPHMPVYPVWDAYEEPLANRLRNRLPTILHRCAVHNVRSVALYGAGLHTRMLVPEWRRAHGPEIREIVVTSASQDNELMGCRIVPADDFNPDSVDAVVLSSSDYEEEMYQTCRKRWPGVNVFPVWDFKLSKKASPDRPFGLSCKTSYERWGYRNRLTEKMAAFLRSEMSGLVRRPKFSFIMPAYNTPGDFLEQALASLRGQLYDNWEVCVVDDGSTVPAVADTLREFSDGDERVRWKSLAANQGIVTATNVAIAMATGDYLIPVDHDDIVEPDALTQIARYLDMHPGTELLYTDNDRIGCANRLLGPDFKPSWSPELLHSWCYIYHAKVFSRRLVEETGPMMHEFECAQDYDYFLRASERAALVGHIPLVLYHHRILEGQSSNTSSSQVNGQRAVEAHLSRRGLDWVGVEQPAFARATGNGIYRLVMKDIPRERVSILILAVGASQAARCVSSLAGIAGEVRTSLTVVSKHDLTVDERETLASLHPRVDFVTATYDASGWHELIHRAAQSAAGEYLVLLDAKNTVAGANWLRDLLVYARMPGIGIVGGKVLRPNDRTEQVGLIHGLNDGLVGPALKNLNREDSGYMHLARVARNCAAVTRDCMMLRKSLFTELGGFDPEMTGDLADADLCLRAGDSGLRVVCTPFVEVVRCDSDDAERPGPQSFQPELKFRARWRNRTDPYYNPNLSIRGIQSHEVASQQNHRLRQFDLSRRALRILSFSHNLNYEGAPYVKLKIDQFLNGQANVKLDVVSAEDGPLRKEYAACGIDVSILDCPPELALGRYESFRDALRERIRAGGYDAVYVNTLMLYWAVDAAYAAGVPCIWNIHESIDYMAFYEERIPDPAVRAAAQAAILKANRLVFVSQATSEMFAPYDAFGVSDVVHNGIDASRYLPASREEKLRLREKLGLPSDGKLVTIVGTVCPRKGQLDFARCAAALVASGSGDHFAIVGTREAFYLASYLGQVKQAAAQYPKQIHLVGETPALEYLRASDVFVCSSYQESFPMVVLEAMSCALPIVTTPVFGIAEQVEDGQSALCYKPGDTQQMVERVRRLLTDENFAAALGATARANVETTFPESRMAAAYYEILQQVALEDLNDVKWLAQDTTVPNPASPELVTAESGESARTAGPASAPANPPTGGLRAVLSSQYLAGEGIEIGALHNPMLLPPGVGVRYVDRLSVDDLRKQYPELADAALVPVDIIDDGERLATVGDESVDFVLANHFIEHCQNPILALQNMVRVLKVGGIVFLAVPDKRFTFDAKREVTSFDHLIRDYLEGPEWSRRSHFEEWVRGVHGLEKQDEIERKIEALLDMDYSIHYHVWTQADVMEWITKLMPVFHLDVEQMNRNGVEVIFILRKTSAVESDPALALAVSGVSRCEESCNA